ncbi:hypothetical protein IQ244_02675 [Nostoc sp. LEGE 06077]|uniref:arginine synthesis PII-interacting regulator PirA n=1 Tax=Nostoc sp. LEGE 06077 TaxID=915325 RepID=UPI001882A1D6|nr:hypothetical protein [Nostoc sp. LEGE 06077]MBE9205453.1 hypothetical protein [Nostoc sp. LEGE 06077]
MSQNRLQAVRQTKEVHRQNLRKNLEHRLEVARSQGDERLINQLEAEMKYLG